MAHGSELGLGIFSPRGNVGRWRGVGDVTQARGGAGVATAAATAPRLSSGEHEVLEGVEDGGVVPANKNPSNHVRGVF